eukprot:c28978_g1_i1 orf=796-3444(-)
MEECCAVCAEPLEWVGYGQCGHREVCSTCVVRLRFVLNDKRCCICKQECPVVFVTKALGDYTKVINDFEALPRLVNAGNGAKDLLYENIIQAYVDDEEQFKMIKAMCRLYCSICEQSEGPTGNDFVKKGYVFRHLDLLQRHLYHSHKSQMCGLCLEGRKVFICEQKLYTKAQLDRHLSRGDLEVDGSEEERGGFSGHPLCDFCRKRFYGDNELYQHMSTEHFTCHLCQRLRPGRYDYYRNYDDLEAHFQHQHFLCEDQECLSKKFIVFPSEAELKRHNALVHGGNMSRAQRNAALQIPVSFQYRRPGQERAEHSSFRRTGRGHGSYSNSQLAAATHARIKSVNLEDTSQEAASTVSEARSSIHIDAVRDVAESCIPASAPLNCDSDAGSSSSTTITTEPSRYLVAVSGSGSSSLEESAFPPLPRSNNSKRKVKQGIQSPSVSMAARLGAGRGRARILNSQYQSQPKGTEGQLLKAVHASELKHVQHNLNAMGLVDNLETSNGRLISAVGELEHPSSTSPGVSGWPKPVPESASQGKGNSNRGASPLSVDEIRTANKALIECIRTGLKGDEQQFNAFKEISSQFRKGEMDATVYHKYILDFGLSHLIPELGRLCPDPTKQKDLLDAHHKGIRGKQIQDSDQLISNINKGEMSNGYSAISKNLDTVDLFDEQLTNDSRPKIRERTPDDNVEVLQKDGYRDAKGKSKLTSVANLISSSGSSPSDGTSSVQNKPAQVLVRAKEHLHLCLSSTESAVTAATGLSGIWTCSICTLENKAGNNCCAACGTTQPNEKPDKLEDAGGSEKRKKKTSKFQRIRLGDGSAATLLDLRENPWGTNRVDKYTDTSNSVQVDGKSFGRGVWRNGGGQRLVSMVQSDELNDTSWSSK